MPLVVWERIKFIRLHTHQDNAQYYSQCIAMHCVCAQTYSFFLKTKSVYVYNSNFLYSFASSRKQCRPCISKDTNGYRILDIGRMIQSDITDEQQSLIKSRKNEHYHFLRCSNFRYIFAFFTKEKLYWHFGSIITPFPVYIFSSSFSFTSSLFSFLSSLFVKSISSSQL